MAFFEASNFGYRVASQSPRRAARTTAKKRASEVVRLGLVVLLLGLWIAGAYAGIVYWALNGSLLGVILSAVVTGVGATSTLSLFGGAEAVPDFGTE